MMLTDNLYITMIMATNNNYCSNLNILKIIVEPLAKLQLC